MLSPGILPAFTFLVGPGNLLFRSLLETSASFLGYIFRSPCLGSSDSNSTLCLQDMNIAGVWVCVLRAPLEWEKGKGG